MKITLVADGRSPITRSWIKNMIPLGYELHLISSYPCDEIPGIVSIQVLPLAFGGMTAGLKKSSSSGITTRLFQKLRRTLLSVRSYLGPLTIARNKQAYLNCIDQISPDLVHALRIPFEGMLATETPLEIPLVVSSWGNDFTLHAMESPLMHQATISCMQRANGFTADCLRDIRLAKDFGLSDQVPTLFVPGNGGFDLEVLEKFRESAPLERGHTVINPRGIRPAYVRNDVFFQAIQLVLQAIPDARFECPGMQGQSEAEKWLDQIGQQDRVSLLPSEPQDKFLQRLGNNSVVVSPATHDGTPNSVLEAMAMGCLPVVGDIESLREWITDGQNGLLVDPTDARSVADGIIRGLRDNELQTKAREINWGIIRNKVDTNKIRQQINDLFLNLID